MGFFVLFIFIGSYIALPKILEWSLGAASSKGAKRKACIAMAGLYGGLTLFCAGFAYYEWCKLD